MRPLAVVLPFPDQGVNTELIELLEKCLEGAKVGAFVGMVGVVFGPCGEHAEVFTPHHNDMPTIVGHVSILQGRLVRMAHEQEGS